MDDYDEEEKEKISDQIEKESEKESKVQDTIISVSSDLEEENIEMNSPKSKAAQFFQKETENATEIQDITVPVEIESKTGPKQKKISSFFAPTSVTKQVENKKRSSNVNLVLCQHCGNGVLTPQAKSTHELYCIENPLRADLHPDKKRKLDKKSKVAKYFVKETENESNVQDTIVSVESESEMVNSETVEMNSSSPMVNEPSEKKKKGRDSYNCQFKANIILKFLAQKEEDENLSYAEFAEWENQGKKKEKICKSMVHKWVDQKDIILQKAYEGCVLKKLRLNPKKNPVHAKTHEKLHSEFIEKRRLGNKISFHWICLMGRKIAIENSFPTFTRKGAQMFVEKFNIKVKL